LSVCTFIASNEPLNEFVPSKEYPVVINIDKNSVTIDDCGANDNFSLLDFIYVEDYTKKKYGVYLTWDYTEGRAGKIIEYIENALKYDPAIEIWHVWLLDGLKIDSLEYDERPIIKKRTVSFSDLTLNDIKELDNAKIWDYSDKRNPNRPSFYCLIIRL